MTAEHLRSIGSEDLQNGNPSKDPKLPLKIASSGVWNAGMFAAYLATSGVLTREALSRGLFEDAYSRKTMIIFGLSVAANLSTLALNTVQSIRMTDHERVKAGQNFVITCFTHAINKWTPSFSRFKNGVFMAGALAPSIFKDGGAVVVGSISYEQALTAAIASDIVGAAFNTLQAVGSEGILRKVRKNSTQNKVQG